LKLYNLDSNRRNNYDFLNLTPQGSISYSWKAQTRLTFNYRGTTRQPTIDQLQPIRDNQDRLNIFIGNPDLKVGFNHNMNASFSTYKMLSQKGFYLSLNYNIPINAITFLNSVDITNGQQTYKPINVNGNRNWNVNTYYYKDGSSKKWSYFIYAYASGGINNNYINQISNGVVQNVKNQTNYTYSNLSYSLRYFEADKLNLEFGPQVGYNASKSSVQKNLNSNYWNYGGRFSGTITIAKKYEFSTDGNFDLRQQLDAFKANPNQIILNASLSRKVFKDNSGKIYILAQDILDQRKGFNRNISNNFISEDRYSRLSRYFLLKFEWSFNKMPGQPTK
jgi:hypothetical protein